MGIFSDIVERNREKAGQVLQSINHSYAAVELQGAVSSFERCIICGKPFSQSSLEEHLRSHAAVVSYIVANRKVIRDVAFLDPPLVSFDICSLGDSDAYAEIAIDGKVVKTGVVHHNWSLGDRFVAFKDAEITVSVRDKNGERHHRLYIGRQPLLRHQELDRLAFELLFRPLDEGVAPRFDQYESATSKLVLTPIEELYKSSFYDYALGFDLLSRRKTSGGHLESALYCLARFNTDFAVAGKRVLALRMNCFGLLADCLPTSRFYLAALFFCAPFGTVAEMFERRPIQSEYGVYIDSLTEGFMDAFAAYYANNSTITESILDKLTEIADKHDTNSHAKIAILGGRHWRRLQNSEKASEHYVTLLSDPDFAIEAKEFIN